MKNCLKSRTIFDQNRLKFEKFSLNIFLNRKYSYLFFAFEDKLFFKKRDRSPFILEKTYTQLLAYGSITYNRVYVFATRCCYAWWRMKGWLGSRGWKFWTLCTLLFRSQFISNEDTNWSLFRRRYLHNKIRIWFPRMNWNCILFRSPSNSNHPSLSPPQSSPYQYSPSYSIVRIYMFVIRNHHFF